MSYTDVFGGETIYPAGQSYLSLTFSVDQQLAWPIENAVAGQNVVSSIMDLVATVAGLNVDIPDARQVSQGIQSVFNNVGGETVTIRDATGGTILSLVPGSAWVAYLTDNTTEAGSWRIFQLGASVSVAVASALAGAGIKAIATTLNQRIAPTSTAVTPITWVDADRAQLTIWTGGVGVLDLPGPGVVGSDWFSMVRNGGSGDLTLTPPSGVIDDAATLILGPGESATVVTDGANFFTVGLGQSTAGFFDFIEINVAGSGDFTLSGVQLNRISYRFVGVLTGDRNIVVPNTVQQYWVDNSTTGAFSLFINTVPQVTPVQVLQGDRTITYCDGTDVVPAESATVSFPIIVAQGGTGANNAATALVNLGAVATTLDLIAGAGLVGGGDLSTNRTFDVGAGTGITVNANDIAADDAAIDHDALLNYDANQHVDHTTVDVTAGAGLTGGGSIDATVTLDIVAAANAGLLVNANDLRVDIDGLTGETPSILDHIMFENSSNLNRKVAGPTFFTSGIKQAIAPWSPTWNINGGGSWSGVQPTGDFEAMYVDDYEVWMYRGAPSLQAPVSGTVTSFELATLPAAIEPTAGVDSHLYLNTFVVSGGVTVPGYCALKQALGIWQMQFFKLDGTNFTGSTGLPDLWALNWPTGI